MASFRSASSGNRFRSSPNRSSFHSAFSGAENSDAPSNTMSEHIMNSAKKGSNGTKSESLMATWNQYRSSLRKNVEDRSATPESKSKVESRSFMASNRASSGVRLRNPATTKRTGMNLSTASHLDGLKKQLEAMTTRNSQKSFDFTQVNRRKYPTNFTPDSSKLKQSIEFSGSLTTRNATTKEFTVYSPRSPKSKIHQSVQKSPYLRESFSNAQKKAPSIYDKYLQFQRGVKDSESAAAVDDTTSLGGLSTGGSFYRSPATSRSYRRVNLEQDIFKQKFGGNIEDNDSHAPEVRNFDTELSNLTNDDTGRRTRYHITRMDKEEDAEQTATSELDLGPINLANVQAMSQKLKDLSDTQFDGVSSELAGELSRLSRSITTRLKLSQHKLLA